MAAAGRIVRGLGVVALVAVVACSGDDSAGPGAGTDSGSDEAAVPPVFPGEDWVQGDPEELGFDPAALERVASEAGPETNCLVVVRHGRLVGEWYWNGWTETSTANVQSVTQAYASTIVGIAQDEGLLDVDDPVSEYLPDWQGTPSEDVTIRHVLSHTTGLRSGVGPAEQELLLAFIQSEDPGHFALSLPQEDEPGTTWSRNIPAIGLLSPILAEATGQEPAEFAQQHLFAPIGAAHTAMQAAPNGTTWVHAMLESNCADLARFGHLILNEGNWDGTQLVSKDWVREATQPSQDLNQGFGLFWWLNRPGSLVSIDNIRTPDYEEPADLRFVADAPEDMFWSIGFGGQVLQIHPGTDTVVVRLGDSPTEAAGVRVTTKVINEALVDP